MPGTTLPITKRYYPKLSEVVTVDDLPEFLSFAQDGLNSLLDSIHYKNLQYSKSFRGDSAFYSLDIVSKNIGLDLPLGLRLVLNPDADGDSTISSFPVSFEYKLEILAFLRSFKLSNFAFTPEAFFNLGLQIFKISDEQVLAHTLNYLVDRDDTLISKYQKLVDRVNAIYPVANLVLPATPEPTVSSVVTLIKQNVNIPKGISALMFAGYILDGDLSVVERKLQDFYNLIVPGGIKEYIHNLITPKFRATLTVSAGLEFPNTILRPVTANGTPIPNAKSLFKFAEATLFVDSEAGIGYEAELAGSLVPEFNQIGNTGLIIGFNTAKLDLSRKTNIPEADAAGYATDFTGLYVKHATITFGRFGQANANNASASIIGDDLFIGTGGISGTIKLVDNGLLHRQFNGFAVELDVFSITFKFGAIINSSISGKLTIGTLTSSSGQPAVIQIKAFIKENGDFEITALPGANIPPLTLPNVFELQIRKFSIGKKERGYYVEVAGKLDFIAQLPVLGRVLPTGIDIKKLLIWDNGDLEFESGTINLDTSFSLKVGPVKLEVTKMTLGAYSRKHNGIDRKYAFFGFDGMINTGNAGVNSTGNGIKYYFSIDNGSGKPFDHFLSIDSIVIDLTIPGNVSKDKASFLLHGYLGMKNPDPAVPGSNAATEYTGSIAFSIPKLKLAGSAGMRLTPSIPAFVVDIGLELATPIPLGPTGVGIYAFRGIIGQKYVPSKDAVTPPLPDTASWWDYYKAKSTITQREGIEIDKFKQKPGFSIGAGIAIATAFDSGLVFSTKLFLLLGLPDVFLLQGQAAILSSRIGLISDVDPPFSALIAIDSSSFRGNLGVDYKLPSSGFIFSLKGTLELAFFFNNSSGWYLNVGRDQPTTERVQARILTLFQGYAYLMISSRGFKAGAGARFDFNKKFGPVAVGFGASLDMGGFVSFKPVQIGAFIQVGGYAYLKIAWFKIGLSIQVSLAVEAPNPFNIVGGLRVKINTPWPLPDIKFNLEIAWRINNNKTLLLQQIPVLEVPNPATGYIPAIATNILSNETFQLNYLNQEFSGTQISIPSPESGTWHYNFNDATEVMNVTIPLDSYIDIELLKPVKPGSAPIGGAGNQLPAGYNELLPPQKGIDSQVTHEFELAGLDIFAWREDPSGGGAWVPYQIYEAVTAIVQENTGANAVDLSALKAGYWQFSEPGKYKKIRLLSQNMFSYATTSTTAHSDLDGLNFRRKDVFCFENIIKTNVVNWESEPLNTYYTDGSTVPFGSLLFTFTGLTGAVKMSSAMAGQSLYLPGGGGLTVNFPSPVSSFSINFGVNQTDVTLNVFKTGYVHAKFGQAVETDIYIDSLFVAKAEQNKTLTYDNLDEPVDKIRIYFTGEPVLKYDGNILLGGYTKLPDEFTGQPNGHSFDKEKGLMFAALYQKSFTAAEVVAGEYGDTTGAAGIWPLDTPVNLIDNSLGISNGSPESSPGFYKQDENNNWILHEVPSFEGNTDAFVIPYKPSLKVENSSFAFEVTAMFDPFEAGISTLFTKIANDNTSGHKKGFALHLQQKITLQPDLAYSDFSAIPSFSIWLTFYNGLQTSAIEVTGKYTLICENGLLAQRQYKHVMVSVDRTANQVTIFIDREPAAIRNIPELFTIETVVETGTYLNDLSYLTEVVQRRQQDNSVTQQGVIDEVQVLSNNLNKTVQPVWRPSTTFAVAVKTRDVVNKNISASPQKTHVFGFRTAGPVGHFHQQSKDYQQLALADRREEFKLANLKSYIDYERSFPDALSRYDLSKPVFYHHPRISLIFIKPYINAMYTNWESYQGLPAVQSKLEVLLLDTFGAVLSPALVWEQLPDVPVTAENYKNLPADQQLLFLLNQAALENSCNENPITVTRKIRQGSYQFPDLFPDKLYTALFNAVYTPSGGTESKQEVHKFNFKTSRFANFIEQVNSFVSTDDAGSIRNAVYPVKCGFTSAEIDLNLKTLIDESTQNDAAPVLNYAVKFDRLVYGGFQLKNLEPVSTTVINTIVNIDPGNQNTKRIIGVLIRNPEPFNDPKLPAELLDDTVKVSLTLPDSTIIEHEQFVYIHSRDTSAVFITNSAMDLPVSILRMSFRYKIFNGADYETEHEDADCPDIVLADYL